MKFIKKVVPVVLSLTMCVSMVAPAFAASFTDLQNAIDGNTDYGFELDGGKWGYGASTDAENNTSYGVVAWDENGTRNVQLNEDVARDGIKDPASIVVKDNVTIDLNGNDIDGKGQATNNALVEVKGGNLTIQDGAAYTDENGEYVSGAVTGGNNVKAATGNAFGGGISVTDGGSLTLEDGAIKDNHADQNGGGVYLANGTVTMNGGLIDGNSANNAGGGVMVNAAAAPASSKSLFTMTGGTISNNETNGGGAGIYVNIYQNSHADGGAVSVDQNSATLSGGSITGNKAATDGAGVFITNGTLTISGTEISENTAGNDGGGVFAGSSVVNMTGGSVANNTANRQGGGVVMNNGTTVTMTGGSISGNSTAGAAGGILATGGTFTMTGGEIVNNSAKMGGGIYLWQNGTVTVNAEGKLYNNSASSSADDIFKVNGSTLILPIAGTMNVQGEDGKNITGWYYDAGDRWGNRYTNQSGMAVYGDTYQDKTLALKAAHDEYFIVSYNDGADGTIFETMTTEVEKGNSIEAPETPTRDGYTFAGWALDDGTEYTIEGDTIKITGALKLTAVWELIPVIEPDVPVVDEPEIEINENAIPLAAGPVTRAQFIDYLWRHEGEPASDGVCTFEDVAEDHEYVLALAWAEQNGIAFAYEDGTFEPDELVTVAAVREFLGNFASVFGTNAVAAANLTSLTGEDDEAVLNCDEVLAEFFGEEYTPALDEEIEIAA